MGSNEKNDTPIYSSYKERSLDPKDMERISIYFSYIEDRFIAFNLPNLFEIPLEDIEKTVDFSKLTLNQMKEILNDWEKVMNKAENISFKVAVTLEYKICTKAISMIKEKLPALIKNMEKLKNELAKDFTSNTTTNPVFANLFKFTDFKKIYDELFAANKVCEKTCSFFVKEKIFQYIRRKVIADKANISQLLKHSKNNVLHLREIRKINPEISQMLAIEFYEHYCLNNLNLSFPYGRESNVVLINPSHLLASKFKIGPTEIGIFTISLAAISNLKRKKGDYLYQKSLTFEITNVQESSMIDLFYPIKVDEQTEFNLQVPVYYSFVRCKLIREQRNAEGNEYKSKIA